MPISANQALLQLKAQPQAFLEKFSVRIFGDPDNSRITSYRIEDAGASQRPGSVLGTLNMHATQKFEIRARGSALGNPAGAVWFDAHSVKMFESNQSAAIGTYTLPLVTGPDLMVTGQLSGCAFAIHANPDGTLVVAHVRPGAAIDAPTLQRTLKNIPFWTVVYGRENYAADRRASVVGCRIAGRWHVWAQKQEETTGDYGIRKVKKLI